MFEQAAGYAAIVAFALGSLLAAISLRRWVFVRRSPASLCPGPRLPLWRRLLPHRTLFIAACRYDLRGLPHGEAGGMTCPECGGESGPRRRPLRHPFRFRAGVAAAMLLAVSLASWAAGARESGRWVRPVPTPVLIAVERAMEHRTPGRLRVELRRRLMEVALPDVFVRWSIPLLIRDLRDDDTPWNGANAMWRLSAHARLAEPYLQEALVSADWQQRQLAADVLRDIALNQPGVPVRLSDHLFRVTVEGVRDDALPAGRGSYTWVNNAESGLHFLTRNAAFAVPYLLAGMDSTDMQQRLLCAAAAGRAGCLELLPKAAPILVEHLRDNHIGEDAKIAVNSLHGFGSPVAPYLRPLLESSDRQQARLARLILEDTDEEFVGPPKADRRGHRDPITGSVANPAREWSSNLMPYGDR